VPEVGETLAGRYKLIGLLGHGGMADVYRAWDSERSTEVAVKVLREDYAEEPEFIRRFTAEAQALARLDHPNIVRFYSFEQDGRVAFIVMDCVRGTTLRGRLRDASGPLPLDEVTRILRDVGAALGFAHRRGFLHRDIKPANIMIDERGRALLSDFGIARAAEATVTTHSFAGTPAYMSPEQILGRPLDARTDIYSLGVVLYEMAAGRRPFVGEQGTGTTTPARVQDEHLHVNPPDPRAFVPGLPADAAATILRALAKDPAQRWPDVSSLVAAWEAAVAQEPSAHVTVPMPSPESQVASHDKQASVRAARLPAAPRQPLPAPSAPRPAARPARPLPTIVLPVLAVTVFCLVGTLVVALLPGTHATPAPTALATERSVATPQPNLLGRIAFESNRDGNAEIYVMNGDGSRQTRLTNNSGDDSAPAWSPDGSRIAFTSNRDGNADIYVMNADGSAQTRLTNNLGADWAPIWSPDGSRIAFESYRDGNWEIYVMNANGSGQTNLTNNPGADWTPAWSPDGRRIAFACDRDGNWEIYVMNADGSGQTRLTNNSGADGSPAWSPK